MYLISDSLPGGLSSYRLCMLVFRGSTHISEQPARCGVKSSYTLPPVNEAKRHYFNMPLVELTNRQVRQLEALT